MIPFVKKGKEDNTKNIKLLLVGKLSKVSSK